jgi:hypothetical protein
VTHPAIKKKDEANRTKQTLCHRFRKYSGFDKKLSIA